jgi:hypothetical protein
VFVVFGLTSGRIAERTTTFTYQTISGRAGETTGNTDFIDLISENTSEEGIERVIPVFVQFSTLFLCRDYNEHKSA